MKKKITTILALVILSLIGWQMEAQVFEDFESGYPAGWTNYQTESDDPGFVITTSQAYSGTQSVYHNDDNLAAISTSWMVTNVNTIAEGVNDYLSFWYRQNYTPTYYVYSGVYISTASGDPIANPDDFVELQEFNGDFGYSEDEWTEYTLSLTSYVGEDVYLAFKYEGDFDHEFYIDDFSLEPIPTCPKPTSLALDNITANSVDVNWVAGNDETEWELVYGAPGFDPETEGETISITDGTPSETITDLDSETDYEVYVIAICGTDDESDYVGPESFTTAISCPAPTGISLDGITTSSLDISWNAGGSETEWVIIYGAPGFDTETEGETIQDTDGTPGETISSLSSGTDYEIYVKAVCSTDDESSLVGPVLFNTATLVDCGVGPVSENFCYGNNEDLQIDYVSSDGSSLNLVINSGFLESCCDDFIVLDSDGTELFNSGGDISGQSFQSTGDQITVIIDSDGSVNCSDNGYDPIDYTVSCATCINPEASYTVVEDCQNGPQFTIDVDLTSIGDATDVTIEDNQGNSEIASATGVYNFGPYANGTLVEFTIENNQDPNCVITSDEFTQVYCEEVSIDCSAAPTTENFCYGNNEDIQIDYISTDGSSLNLVVNSGFLEACCDDFIVLDSDGTELFNSGGDISGQSFQSTGDQITVIIDSDGSVNCSDNGYDPIDYTVSCATCINPQASYTVVEDCENGPQFTIDVDLTSIGDATDVTIEDNQGNSEIASATGIYNFGPYANGTLVEFTIENNQDSSCVITSDEFTQEYCTEVTVDCAVGPVTENFCYGNNEDLQIDYISTDGSLLNLVVNSGFLETCCDDFIVLDSDGTELFNSGGDISGQSFQSTGDQITVIIDSDGSVNCSDNGYDPIDYTVSCATCTNPQASYQVVSNCDSGNDEFFVETNITDLGTALSLTLSDNQSSTPQTVSETGIVTFGPYPNATGVQITIENDDDINCVVNSQSLTQIACPPENDLCVDALPAVVNSDEFCVDTTPVVITAANGSNVPVSCQGPVAQDVWFEFTAIAADQMITLIGAPFNVAHAIYEGECDNLTEMYCSSEFDNFGNSPGIVATGLTVGETYYIRVFSSAATSASFDLCITSPDYEEDNTSCADVAPFCAPFDSSGNPEPLIFANGYYYLEESVAEEGPDYGCLGSEPNPAWFYLQVDQAGDLEFEIVQNTAFDGDGNAVGTGLDVDFIVYGPFSELEGNCDNLTDANEVDCSYSAAAIEEMVLPNALAGDIYLVLITNFNQSPGYISLLQTNYGETGGGTTDCSILENIVYACEGTEVTLTANNPDDPGFLWYESCDENFDNCTMIPIEQASGPSIVVDEEGYYKVRAFDAQGLPRPFETFHVIYSPSPELAMDELQSLCGVSSLDLDATPTNATEFGSFTYTWYQDGDEISGETSSTLNVTEPGEYTVEVSGTLLDEEGNEIADQSCSTQMTVEVTNAEFTVDLGDDQTFCDTASYTAEAIVDGEDDTNATYVWYDDSGDVIADATASTYEITATGNYTVEVEIQGCVAEDEIQVVFSDSPEVDLGNDEIIVCDGSDAVVTATVFNSSDFDTVNYEWLDSSGAEVPGAGNNDTASLAPGDTYTVNVTGVFSFNGSTYSCETSEEIFINDTAFTVDLGGDQSYCDDSMQDLTAVITGTPSDDATYTWFYNGDEIAGETTQTISVNEDGNYQVEVNINGCVETQNVDLLFDLRPQVDLGEDTSVCDLSINILDATPANMDVSEVTFEWSYQGSVITGETNPTLDPSIYGFGTYEVTVVSLDDPSMTCAAIQNISLSNTQLNVSVGAAEGSSAIVDVQYCEEDGVPTQEIVLNADASGEGIDASGITYIWYMNGVEIPGETGSSYTAVYEEAGEYNYEYTVEAYYGASCSGSASISTEVLIEPYGSGCTITQGISPNADGMNDCLDLTFLSERSGIASLKVYNRYGRLIFESSNYVDSFCGQNEEGEALVTGTYFYVLEMKREDPVFGNSTKGWIYVNQVE